jgi:hypothetical protein
MFPRNVSIRLQVYTASQPKKTDVGSFTTVKTSHAHRQFCFQVCSKLTHFNFTYSWADELNWAWNGGNYTTRGFIVRTLSLVRTITFACVGAGMGQMIIYYGGKRSPGKQMRRREDNIKVDLCKVRCEWVNWIGFATMVLSGVILWKWWQTFGFHDDRKFIELLNNYHTVQENVAGSWLLKLIASRETNWQYRHVHYWFLCCIDTFYNLQ